MKNATYYSIAAGFAEEVGARFIFGGHNLDDAAVFEDTGDEFFKTLERAFLLGSKRLRASRTTIQRPLRGLTKAQVVSLAARTGVPLGWTWSCHREGETHCWRCPGCTQRKEAFRLAGVEDPLATVAKA